MDAAIVVESFSAGPSDFSDMTYNSCRSLVYACLVLATPMRAFIHDVSPGLASLVGASSTSSSSVYACPVLATPVRAFVHDVSPGLANPPRRVVNNIFSPTHHYIDTTAPMLTRRPLAPAAPRRLPRHQPPRLESTTAFFARLPRPRLHHPRSRLHRQTAQRAIALLEQPRRLPLQPLLRDASTVTTVGGVRRLAFGFFSSLTVCIATVVTAGGC